MKQILLVFLLSAGSCFSQDSLVYKAAIFDSNDSSLVAYVFAPELYVVSKEQLVFHLDSNGLDSLVEFAFDQSSITPLKMYHEYGLTGVSIYLNEKEQQRFLLKSNFKYHLYRPFQVPEYNYESEEFGVIIKSIEKDMMLDTFHNQRVEKILGIRNNRNLMETE